jgi:hypothetical protein
MRCDTPAGVNGFNNMQDRAIKGTTDWTRHEFTIDVPADVANINFGFILAGDGAVWFDDIEITLDGVAFDDPDLFSLDFEDDKVKFLKAVSGEYAMTRSEARPHTGKKSLEIRRRPASEAFGRPELVPVVPGFEGWHIFGQSDPWMLRPGKDMGAGGAMHQGRPTYRPGDRPSPSPCRHS